MADGRALIDAVAQYPQGSCAPHVVSWIWAMPDMTDANKRALATIFLAAYDSFTEDDYDENAR